MIETLIEALGAEFDGDVAFAPNIPTTIVPPVVIVSPGDPFLAPATHGTILETWDVLVAVGFKDTASAVADMRSLSLRVRDVVLRHGALWRITSGPRRGADESKQVVIAVSEVAFKYPPPNPGGP
jgi:hypothetical protein